MFKNLWILIPDEAYILLLVGIGVATIVGIFSPAQAVGLVLMVCLIALATPFLDPFIDMLPDWAVGLLCLCFVIALIGTLFGRRVQENVISMIIFSLIAFPFKVIGRLIGIGRRLR
jgi:prepilin signal peptidase PulO-like enzyme (type II secretory pathway)